MKIKTKLITAMKLLSRFKYLTSTQFVVLLGVYSQKGTMTNGLKELTDMSKPLVGTQSFGSDPKKGRLSNVYFLTKYGVQYLIDNHNFESEDIYFHNENSNFFNEDYSHRIATIDYKIKLYKWVENSKGDIDLADTYFDFTGSNNNKKGESLKASTKIDIKDKFIIPDMVNKFTVNNTKYLFAFEQHNGDDTKKLIKQLTQYCLALKENIISKEYNHNKSIRVVVVFEKEGAKRSAIKRLKEYDIFIKLANYFIFKTNKEMIEDFYHNWSLVTDKKVDFLEKA